MSGLNKAILIGNLGQDPGVRTLPSGDSVANLSLATSERWTDRNTGELKERTEWHRVALFGRVAEIAGEYLGKGSRIQAPCQPPPGGLACVRGVRMMSKQPTTHPPPARLSLSTAALQELGLDAGTWKVLTDSIFPSAKTTEGIALAVRDCQARGLDVLKRSVHVVPMWSKVPLSPLTLSAIRDGGEDRRTESSGEYR